MGIHVDDFIIGGDKSKFFLDARQKLQEAYRWGSWKTGQSEFSGLRIRQWSDYSIEVDLEDYTSKFITEAR